MNLNLINLLLVLKNASLSKKEVFFVKYNKMCEKLLKLLYSEGLISSYSIEKTSDEKLFFRITLKYFLIIYQLQYYTKKLFLKKYTSSNQNYFVLMIYLTKRAIIKKLLTNF